MASSASDPAKAKAKLAEAGGFKGGKMTLSYNADSPERAGPRRPATPSRAPSVSTVSPPRSWTSPPSARRSVTPCAPGCRKMKGMFRTGWQMDYPSIENFLAPLYATGASSNDGDYSNPAFDKAPRRGCCTAADPAAANKKYPRGRGSPRQRHAGHPHVWHYTDTMGWSDKVTGVKITAFGTIDFPSISLK